MLCLCESGYLYIVLEGFLRILGTPTSILLHLINICFLPCICLWQMSKIQTCLCVVVGTGFVSTSPAFIRSSASHLAGSHGQLAKKCKSGPHCRGREVSPQFAQQFVTVVTAPHPHILPNWILN